MCGLATSGVHKASAALIVSAWLAAGLRLLERNVAKIEEFGRPMYSVNDIAIPEEGTGNRCASLRFDITTHSFEVDTKLQDESSVAWACFDDRMEETGWCGLEVSTTKSDEVPLSVRSYGAGLLEGLLTQKRIYQFHENGRTLYNKDTGDGHPSLRSEVDRTLGLIRVVWADFAGGDAGIEPVDPYAKQAWVALLQMRGIRDGHNLAANKVGAKLLTAEDMLLMNMHAELPALVQVHRRALQNRIRAANATAEVRADFPIEPPARWGARRPHGSAVARRLGPVQSPEDLLMGHVTFGDYGEMTRIFKHYSLHAGSHASTVAMSSYPGCVGSTDDYIMNDKGFVAMSTSLFVPGHGKYAELRDTIDGLPSFVRSLIATRVATSPLMWARIYGFFPGIAGGKQWILADYNKLHLQQPLSKDTVWLVESLPGLQSEEDVSEKLRTDGFFEVHAEPLLTEIRHEFGLPALYGTNGTRFTSGFGNSLLEEAMSVQSIENLQALLGSSQSVPAGATAVTSRLDLDPEEPIPFGGIDAKVTSKCLVQKLGSQIHAGPPATPGGDGFKWASLQDRFPDWPRKGLPAAYTFDWVDMLPGALGSTTDESNAECSDDETVS